MKQKSIFVIVAMALGGCAADFEVAVGNGGLSGGNASNRDAHCMDAESSQSGTVEEGGFSGAPLGFLGVRRCIQKGLGDTPVFQGEFYFKPQVTWVTRKNLNGGYRDYGWEHRPWLERLLINIQAAYKIDLKVSFSEPSFTESLSLLTIKHKGNTGVEEWETVFMESSSGSGFPLVRVGANTSFDIVASVSETNEAGTQVISAARALIRNVNLDGKSIFNKLNALDLQQDFFNKQLETTPYFRDSKTESILVGQRINRWRPGSEIRIEPRLPVRIVGSSGDSIALDHGYWQVSLTRPQYSLFDSEEICGKGEDITGMAILSTPTTTAKEAFVGEPLPPAAYENRPHLAVVESLFSDHSHVVCRGRVPLRAERIAYRIPPHRILNYEVRKNTFVESYLKSQSWYSQLRDSVVVAYSDPKKRQDAAFVRLRAQFCDNVISTAYNDFSFNKFDASMTLWALISAGSDFSALRELFVQSDTCRAHIEGLGLAFEPPPRGTAPLKTRARRN
jgi:hypothetical protein